MIGPRTLAQALRPFLDHGNLEAVAAEILAAVEESHGFANGETFMAYLHLSQTPAWSAKAREIATGESKAGLGPVAWRKAQCEAMEDHARRCMGIPADGYSDGTRFLVDYMEQSFQRVDWAALLEMFGEA